MPRDDIWVTMKVWWERLEHDALQEARELWLIRHYGVSNFTAPLLEEAMNASGGKGIINNQFEVSPFLANRKLVDATQRLGVTVTTYMRLSEGRAHNDSTIRAIAEKHHATPAQVAFAWLLTRDIMVITTSTNPEHQQSNWEAQKLKLDATDIAKLDALDEERCNANPSFAPKW
ncbi:Methylglyoxal reductase, acetol producing / 2,5-diketo-D-gluconic acid reductase B [Candidatus Paraburkholderia calva]|nr:Methylglyoxal reductase, acetol producing / 2,5-diketo-D-gluconic acid reductase B [Candidatus Paraburkholderia calva]